MTTATRSSVFLLLTALLLAGAFALLAVLLLAGCASSSWPAGWSHEHVSGGSGYWEGLQGEPERFYSGEHPTASPISHTAHTHNTWGIDVGRVDVGRVNVPH